MIQNLIPKVHAVDINQVFLLGGKPIESVFPDIGVIITVIAQNMIVIASILLFLILAGGGVMYILSSGGGDQEGMEKGKNALTGALVGYIIVFGAFWLIKIVEFVFGVKIINSGL